MKGNGKMIHDMDGVMSYILMEIFIQVNSKKAKPMERVVISGLLQEKFMMVSGRKGLDMAMEFGKKLIKEILMPLETHIQENGREVKQMVMEFIHGVMVINMRGSGNSV